MKDYTVPFDKPVMRTKGTGWQRFIVRSLTVVLTVLVYWLLGFFVQDIRTLRGPEFSQFEDQFLDQTVLEQRETLQGQLVELNRQINNQSDTQQVVADGSRNLQQTITQLIELQKLGIENQVALAPTEQENLSSTLGLFLENQRRYQELSQSGADLLDQKQALELQLTDLEATLESQRRPALEAYREQSDQHRLKLAFLQLGVLLPILLVSAGLLVKRRSSPYFPLFLALGLATLFKVGMVIHEYFPTRYFKYVLIGALLLVVTKMLIHFIRSIAQPKTEWLLKQYREAYERFLCPVCDYPIRTGPRRHLFWTRRTVAKMVALSGSSAKDEAYTCPACGSELYNECSKCHGVRHALLPHCQHCGDVSESPQGVA